MKVAETKKSIIAIEELDCIKELSDSEAQTVAGGMIALTALTPRALPIAQKLLNNGMGGQGSGSGGQNIINSLTNGVLGGGVLGGLF
ncbi:MAG: hypothetical protein MUD14_15525 [Hydrococcus sp. Prado102]|jgi:hypothetical protein|nr:hypothetical protein [Hydrococcus sp. Prado102]